MDPPLITPLAVVESLAPLRKWLLRAQLPRAVLALQEEEGDEEGGSAKAAGEACVLLVNDGQPALRLVDAARLAATYGLNNHANSNGSNGSDGRTTPTTEEEAPLAVSPSSTTPSRSPPLLLASLLSPQGKRGGGGNHRPVRSTADVFLPVPTPDSAGIARLAVAAGATLEGLGATERRQRQHILVRPPGGAVVLVLTASSASTTGKGKARPKSKAAGPSSPTIDEAPAPVPMPPVPIEEEERQEVGLEAGEAGIGSYFPTLRIEHRCCEDPGEVYANTPRPIPVETEAFAGHALLLIRDDSRSPPEPRHHYHLFEGKQRRFNIQVQGRLKRALDNPYFGGEVTRKMELGLLAKGFARTILGFIRALQPEMHHSFGDDDNVQLAHICVPLFQAAETFVLTPPGEAPPPMGQNFPASDQDKLRRAGKLPAPRFEEGCTLSFSFHSMFIDFQSWRLVNFPLIRSLDLHLMWAKSALRFVVYEPGDAEHRQATNRYVYVLQIQHSSNLTGGPEEEVEVGAAAADSLRPSGKGVPAGLAARPLLRGTSLEAEAEAEAAEEGSAVGSETEGEEEEEEEEASGSMPIEPPPPVEAGEAAEGEREEEEGGATTAGRVLLENYFPDSPSKKGKQGRQRSLSGSASWFPQPPPLADTGPQGSSSKRRHRRRRFLPLPRLRPEDRSFTLSAPSMDAAEEEDEQDGEMAPLTTVVPARSTAVARLLLQPAGPDEEDALDLVPAWVEAAAPDGSTGGSGPVAAVAGAVRRRRAARGGGTYRLWFALCLGGGSDRVCRLRGRKAVVAALRPFAPTAAPPEEEGARGRDAGNNNHNPRFSEREQQRRQLCGLLAEARRRARAGDARATTALVALCAEPSPVDRAFLAGELIVQSPASPPLPCSPLRGSFDGGQAQEQAPISSPPTSPLTAAKEAATGLIARTLSASSLGALLPTKAAAPSRPGVGPRVMLRGPVARCLGDCHWAEERLVLTRVALSFYYPAANNTTGVGDDISLSSSFQSQQPRLTVAVRDVMGAAVLAEEDSPPFPCFAFFEVATLGRVYTCMVKTAAEAASWVAAVERAAAAARREAVGGSGGQESGEEEAAAADFMSGYAVSTAATLLASSGGGGGATVAEAFVAAPSHWALGDRVVLTARRPVLGRAARANIREQDPCAVMARLLAFGFTLDASSGHEELAIFLDGAAALKHLDRARLQGVDEVETERRKKAFFLNLYTTGVLLARLILGPPPANSALRWCGYYTSAAVEALGDLFSLAEIEHNVLRAPSPRAKGALLRLLLPNTRYPRALTPRTPDLRLNFALNCGSLACPAAVPVYDPDTLDAQLNLVTRFVLDSAVRVDERARAVVLPKVCQWYARDFGGQLIALLLQCLSPPKAAALRRMLAVGGAGGGGGVGGGSEEAAMAAAQVAIKYAPFAFETRPLRRLDEEEEALLMQM